MHKTGTYSYEFQTKKNSVKKLIYSQITNGLIPLILGNVCLFSNQSASLSLVHQMLIRVSSGIVLQYIFCFMGLFCRDPRLRNVISYPPSTNSTHIYLELRSS